MKAGKKLEAVPKKTLKQIATFDALSRRAIIRRRAIRDDNNQPTTISAPSALFAGLAVAPRSARHGPRD